MIKHPVDVTSVIAYVAGGGLAGVFVFLGALYPEHANQFTSAAVALVAFAGALRVAYNHTPAEGTQSVTTTIPAPQIPTPDTLTTEARVEAVSKLKDA